MEKFLFFLQSVSPLISKLGDLLNVDSHLDRNQLELIKFTFETEESADDFLLEIQRYEIGEQFILSRKDGSKEVLVIFAE